ncbi:hypothetical protein EKK70_07930 [Desulfovibrio sp. DS-1]|nr:hypothetical protein EKK70_07930 [Desulfovibrio sp. DS-1]
MPHARRVPHAEPLHAPRAAARVAARVTAHDARHAFEEPSDPHAPRTTGNTTGSNAPSRWLGALLGPQACTVGVAMALATLLTGCGDKTPPGETVVMRACRICHGTERICADIGKLDRAGWEKTVDRMIAGGASVTPEERAAVIDWLSTRKPGDKPLCP